MLKKLIVTMALVGVTAASYAQGMVEFNTGGTVNSTVYLPLRNNPANTPAGGTGFFAQLYSAAGINAAVTALAPVGNPVNLRTGGNIGKVQVSGTTSKGVVVDPVVQVTSVAGGPATVQIRAWTSNYDTYELAEKKANAMWGTSSTLNLTATGNPNGVPPTTPAPLDGISNTQLQDVPEPSTIALGVLGAAALLFARRRK